MRIYLTKTDERDALAKYGWNAQVPRRPPVTQWRVHLNVFQAKNLVSGDTSGVSDPFLVANLFGVEKATSVIDNTVNPVTLRLENKDLSFCYRFGMKDLSSILLSIQFKTLTQLP